MTRWFIQRVKPRFPELFRLPPRSWNCGETRAGEEWQVGIPDEGGRAWGPGSAEAGRSRQRIWALFPPQVPPQARLPGPAPTVPTPTPPSPLLDPGRAWATPRSPGYPSSWPAPAQSPFSHSLGELRTGVLDRWAAPLGGARPCGPASAGPSL